MSRQPAAALLQRGAVAHRARRLAEAEGLYRQALAAEPGHPDALYLLGMLLSETGRLPAACATLREAAAAAPARAPPHAGLGAALLRAGDLPGAVRSCARALELEPAQPEVLSNLGHALTRLGLLSDALEVLRRARELAPRSAEAAANQGNALKEAGRIEEAVEAYRAALALDPGLATAGSNLLLALCYSTGLSPAALLAEHRAWELSHGTPRTGTLPPAAPDDTPGRRLRVGYVSPDLRLHSVAFFVEPLLAAHDRSRFEVFCYADVARPDAVTARLSTLVGQGWRDACALGDEALAHKVRADRIDLLVDLAGHTAHHRLGVFARRPAPVQLTWLGYPATTGLRAMDFRLVDAWSDPPGSEDACAERLLRVEGGFLCYRPPDDAPEVAPAPCGAAGPVTIGSFNQLAKHGPETVALWARVLAAVPGSRLLLKARGLGDAGVRAGLAARFAACGVDPSRLEALDALPDQRAHLAAYGRVDLALDTVPYNGTTTTCEALWMGVPVVAVAGDRHAARVGQSLLRAAGLAELVAGTEEEFVAKAAALAADRPRLAALRAGLRGRLRASRLTDGAAFAAAFERALLAAWEARAQPPAEGGRA